MEQAVFPLSTLFLNSGVGTASPAPKCAVFHPKTLPPQPQDDYSVLFEDTSYADGYLSLIHI